jgi:flavin-dependent dehydrogenase
VTAPGGLDQHVSVTVDGTFGLGVPRRVLEETLLEAAREAGVTVEMGVRVVSVKRQEHGWAVAARRGPAVEQHSADLAILADGRFTLAARGSRKGRRRGWFGWNATFGGVPQRPGDLSMHFFPFGYFGVLTFRDGTSNVCGLTYFGGDAARTWDEHWHDALDRQPCLSRLMAGTARLSNWQGVGPLPFTSAMRLSDGPILAGDAAAVGDPYMGEGISRALGSGPILLHTLTGLADGDLDGDAIRSAYQQIWMRRYASRLKLGAATRRLQRRPRLFLWALGVLAPRPRMMRAVTRVFHPSSPGREAHSTR